MGLAAASLTLTLAACSAEASATGARSASPGTTGVPSTPATSAAAPASGPSTAAYLPEVPAKPAVVAADVADKAHAVDFVVAWFQGLNRAFATGDADVLRESTGLGCFTCQNWVIEIQDLSDGGLTRRGGQVELGTVVYRGRQGENFLFRASLTRRAGALVDASGATVGTLPESGQQVVDLMVGVSTSSVTGNKSWTMRSVAEPPPDNGQLPVAPAPTP